MSTAIIVYKNRTACAAAAWLLRRHLATKYDYVLAYQDNGKPITPVEGAAYYFISKLPKLNALIRDFGENVKVTYIAKCIKNVLACYGPHYKHLKNFTLITDENLTIIDIMMKHLELDDHHVPELILWLAHRFREKSQRHDDMTRAIYSAFSIVEDHVERLDEYCHPDQYQENLLKLVDIGNALEQRHIANMSEIVKDHTFNVLLGRGEGIAVPVTVVPKHLRMGIAYYIAKQEGFGVVAHDDPSTKMRNFLLVKNDGCPMDIFAIAKHYNGNGGAMRCRFELPLLDAVQLME